MWPEPAVAKPGGVKRESSFDGRNRTGNSRASRFTATLHEIKMMKTYEPILLKNMLQPGYTGSLAEYERAGGYQALRKVVGKVRPAEVTATVDEVGVTRTRRRGISDRSQMGISSQGLQGPALSLLQCG